jgi:hypothetical protein
MEGTVSVSEDLPAPVVLAQAFKEWDRWAATVSRRADLARATGRPIPRQLSTSGEKVTHALVQAERNLADELGMKTTKLHEKLVVGRRQGASFWQVLAGLGVPVPPEVQSAVPAQKPVEQVERARRALREGVARQRPSPPTDPELQ